MCVVDEVQRPLSTENLTYEILLNYMILTRTTESTNSANLYKRMLSRWNHFFGQLTALNIHAPAINNLLCVWLETLP